MWLGCLRRLGTALGAESPDDDRLHHPDAMPKRMRSQTGPLRLWGQVVIEIMTYLCKKLKCIILSPINFGSAKSNSMRQVAKGSKQEKSG